MKILAFETSCDETGVAVVEDGRTVRSNVLASQVATHAKTGGIVPEIAAREHLRAIDPLLADALHTAGLTLRGVDAVAATVGPGLAGCLLVGANYARALALAAGLPFIGVNHLEGHVYANWLATSDPPRPDPELPAVVLVVSGAHSDLAVMERHREFRLLGRTIDDAAGEAFDKVARLLGLGFPGGPEVERAATSGDPSAVPLPRAWLADSYDFSFSGLKTAVLRHTREHPDFSVPDVAASFQKAVAEVLAEKTARAAAEYGSKSVLLGGGVAANTPLRDEIAKRVGQDRLRVPPPRLCTDNGAMIGAAAFYATRYRASDGPLAVRPNLTLA
ncbi:MAG TPA: tRNA (adenosine(37)-N6)-threonylcarbamoyltransferase complex transferase subunit TsaD [Candidatus Limnocylindria bacterium]|nr:tRNA (adenosine(37)-N6)-threonylcarbamoyltransferase complex transferase subunit TsaD [Candidatus Limnocylindria bacterium]